MSEIEIEIDGQLLSANQGDSIITIADREGIEVPRFCYHKKLSVYLPVINLYNIISSS